MVIGILAALLLPALSRAKAAAKRIDCANNLRQIALASHLYAADCEDFLPPLLTFSPRSFGVGKGWHVLLWTKYLDKNTNVFQCAENLPQLQRILRREDPVANGLFHKRRDVHEILNFAYGANPPMLISERPLPGFEQFSMNDLGWSEFYSRKIREIASPSDCVAFGDRPGWYTLNSRLLVDPQWSFQRIWHGPWSSSGHPDYTFMISRRHAGRSNMAFLDGHVEHGSLRDWTLLVPAVWNRWHHRNHFPAGYEQILDADNWSPLYGADEFLPLDNGGRR